MKRQKQPHGIICLWQLKPVEKRKPINYFDDNWEIIESYTVDEDGRPLGPVINVDGKERHPHLQWLHKPILDEEGDHFDSEEIMGRAVTMWSMSGVSLLDIHPENWDTVKWARWSDLLKLVQENKHLFKTIFSCGYSMCQGTEEEARKVMFKDDAIELALKVAKLKD